MSYQTDQKPSSDQVTEIDIGTTGRDFTGNVAGRDIIQRITQVFTGGPDPERDRRNRQAMLKLVKDFWVKGVLESSLHGKVLIELQMEERQDAVGHPWEMVLQTPEQSNKPLSPDTKIVDVFDDANQALLILGAPGSGKTTMLLELARDTIVRAEQDDSERMPVVFNLSSWSGQKQSIAEWIIEELSTKYNIPKKIAHPWLEQDEFLLLFDGLDEVAFEQRDNCVIAINEFHQEYLMPVVVCSRIADYEALSVRLNLRSAVLLQPLSDEQIDDYFTRAGVDLTTVQETLQHDEPLHELAQSPLMLSIMTLAYQGISAKELQTVRSVEDRREHVFAAYVQQMFKRRQVKSEYSPEQTIYWLAWLAQNLFKHAQTVFVIERMQPSWLPDKQRQIYMILVRLLSAFLGCLSGAMLGSIIISLVLQSDTFETFGFWLGGFIGALIGFNGRFDCIKPIEILKWSWAKTQRRLAGGFIFGVLIGLIAYLFFGLFANWEIGLFAGLTITPIGMFFFLLLGGLTSLEIETRVSPNQGIWQSFRNAIVISIVLGSVFLGIFELYAGVIMERISSSSSFYIPEVSRQQILLSGGIFGLAISLLSGLRFGGFAVMQHFILRTIGRQSQYLPRLYTNFLDTATERIFLQKVGGGYIFIHRLMLEYFGSLSNLPAKDITVGISKHPILHKFDKLFQWGINTVLIIGFVFSLMVMVPDFTNRLRARRYWSQGIAYEEMNYYEQAMEEYDKAIQLDSGDPDYYHSRGNTYGKMGDYESMLKEFNKAITLDPSYADYYLGRGFAYREMGNYVRALEDHDKAISLNPDFAEYYYGRGLAYSDMGNYERALEDYDKAITLNPNSAKYYYGRGLTYGDMGNYERALEDHDKAISLAPNFAEYYYGRGLTYGDMGNYERALEDHDKAISLNPDFAEYYYGRGNTYGKMGNYERALEDHDKAISLAPNFAEYYYGRGLTYGYMGNYEHALEDHDKAISLNPDFAEYYYGRGLAYSDMGNYERALEDYEQCLELDPIFYARDWVMFQIEKMRAELGQ